MSADDETRLERTDPRLPECPAELNRAPTEHARTASSRPGLEAIRSRRDLRGEAAGCVRPHHEVNDLIVLVAHADGNPSALDHAGPADPFGAMRPDIHR
jgi:hypothetical protein